MVLSSTTSGGNGRVLGWFVRSKKAESPVFTLADYAQDSLIVFETSSHEEQARHAAKLFEAANHAGDLDFLQ
jgi:hypothetical protein